MATPVGLAISSTTTRSDTSLLTETESAILRVLQDQRGRVVTRTQLARAAGLRNEHARRVDSHLVAVRRVLSNAQDEVVNVRSRGWMLR